MKFKILIAVFFSLSVGFTLAANAKQFEYKTVDYTVQTEFMATAKELGTQGWELASCVTSDASSYSAYSSGAGSITGLMYARTSYCIFKREI